MIPSPGRRRAALSPAGALSLVMSLTACAPQRSPTTSPTTSPEPDAVTPTPADSDAWECPDGPFPVPLTSDLQAEAIAGTAPSDLDPADTAFHLYEGPVWYDDALHFSDFRTSEGFPSRILRYAPDQGLTVRVEDSGTNGLALDPEQRLAGARHKSKSIVVFDENGAIHTEVAKTYEGRGFYSPNDLVFRGDGNLYFTDPDFQAGGREPQPTTNVYRVAPDGTVHIVDDGIANPNGVSLSPTGHTLYVAGNLEEGYLKAYPVSEDGSVGAGEILLDGVEVPDGMAIDCAGNIYVTEHNNRQIRVVAPDGRELGKIVGMDANVTNAAFGGPQRKTLYITGTGALYKVELPVPGFPY